jgi:hypothetical protein
MTEMPAGRWESAKRDVVERWRRIIECIDARDDRGAIGLASARDRFCEEAIADMNKGFADFDGGEPMLHSVPARGSKPGTHCFFCRAFYESGGCLGALDEMERAVFEKRWDEAREVALRYISRIELLDTYSSGL